MPPPRSPAAGASSVTMVRVGLFVRLEAAPGRESQLADLLRDAKALVDAEPDTVVWYAIRFDQATFGIFDAFDDDEGRQAHLNGAVAEALEQNAGLFREPPSLQPVDVLASK
jgi:quinol monooxygenase YgiN